MLFYQYLDYHNQRVNILNNLIKRERPHMPNINIFKFSMLKIHIVFNDITSFASTRPLNKDLIRISIDSA